jgi:hypothetical protein
MAPTWERTAANAKSGQCRSTWLVCTGAAHALGVEPASIAKIRAQKELFAFWKRDAILLIVHTTM